MADPHQPNPPHQGEMPTAPVTGRVGEVPSRVRLFGSRSFFRLWLAQLVSSLGDWIGLVAILSLAARVGGRSPEASIGVVMSARMIPGFFFGSVGGVLVDRLDRKKVMVACDIGRGLVVLCLPFVTSVWGLFLASLALEMLTLLWTPAKEASVPNMVAPDQLTTANSLSLVAAYGSFPLAGVITALLFKVAEWLGGHSAALHFLLTDRESVALYFDVATYFMSALLISTLVLPRTSERRTQGIELGRSFQELKEGWRFIGSTPVVKAVLTGLGTGLVGGGMVVPLGPTYATRVLHAGPAGFSLLLTSLGTGVAIGVVVVSAIQRRLPRSRIFPWAVLGAGGFMLAGTSMSSLALCMTFVTGMGICTGAVYVVGVTLLQESVDDELRGRIFATLYTLVRLCLIVSLAVSPLVAGLLERVGPGVVHPAGLTLRLPGVRLTLWLGAAIIVSAGLLARRTCKAPARPG